MDRLDKLCRRTVFQENAGRASFECPQRTGIGHARSDHEDVPCEAGAPAFRFFEKGQPVIIAEIVVEQHDIHLFPPKDSKSLGGRGTRAYDPEVRLSFE